MSDIIPDSLFPSAQQYLLPDLLGSHFHLQNLPNRSLPRILPYSQFTLGAQFENYQSTTRSSHALPTGTD